MFGRWEMAEGTMDKLGMRPREGARQRPGEKVEGSVSMLRFA